MSAILAKYLMEANEHLSKIADSQSGSKFEEISIASGESLVVAESGGQVEFILLSGGFVAEVDADAPAQGFFDLTTGTVVASGNTNTCVAGHLYLMRAASDYVRVNAVSSDSVKCLVRGKYATQNT